MIKINENTILAALISENIDAPCYISDIDTYELLYINNNLKMILNIEGNEYYGCKCYELLQNNSSPCMFCNNAKLKEKKYYVWEHYNQALNRYYELKDTLIYYNNRKLRLEIGIDVTFQKNRYQELAKKIEVEQTLLQCANTLSSGIDVKLAIDTILSIVGKYYNASRAYLFEIDDSSIYMNNTHEWCQEGVKPKINEQKNIPLSTLSDWIEKFKNTGEFFIDSVNNYVSTSSAEYRVLSKKGIKSVIAVPLVNDEEVVGFIAVDDPATNKDNTRLLRSLSLFILDNLNKLKVAEKLQVLSTHDKLTGLYNRYGYDNKLQELQLNKYLTGIIFIDVNGLKKINDEFGHFYGDHYIKKCANLLKMIFNDNVYRIGGDEFIVLLSDVTYEFFNNEVRKLKEKLLKANNISMSMGTSWYEGSNDIHECIKEADVQMLKNKQEYYNQSNKCLENYQNNAENELIRNLLNENFEIWLQPKIDLDSNKVIGAEVLIRKIDGLKLILPSAFISKYEKQGNIYILDLYALQQACYFLNKLKRLNVSNIFSLSVNFSRYTILKEEIDMLCIDMCDSFNIDLSEIIIEISDSYGMDDTALLVKKIKRLKASGFRISLDNLGAKNSNIEMPNYISFDEIKLDGSLLSSDKSDPCKHIVLEHMIKMYKSFSNISIVVKGIETSDQVNYLKEISGLIGQGYLFAKPMSQEEFIKYLVVNS